MWARRELLRVELYWEFVIMLMYQVFRTDMVSRVAQSV
jgi:hypothetical protein